MGGKRGAADAAGPSAPAPGHDLVRYLAARERGLLRRAATRWSGGVDMAQELGEEKATLPVKNQSCELSGQSRATFLMTFSPDGTLIASTHGDHTVRVTDVQSGRCRHILTGHPRTPWCIAFHPASNDILASGCLKGEVRIWDLRGGGSERWASEDGSVISSVTFHPTDQVLVIATGHELLFWDWTRPEPFARCKTASKGERVKWVKFDPLGHRLFTAIANTTAPREEAQRGQHRAGGGQHPAGGGVSYINRDTPDTDERRRLRQRYSHLVHQITTHQRDRIVTHDPPAAGLDPHPHHGAGARAAGGSGQGGLEEDRAHTQDHDQQEEEEEQHPPTSTSHIAGMTFSGPHHADMIIVEPQSPVHVEAVENAREYASIVTRSTALSLTGARQYAAAVTSASLSGEDVEREVIRVRNDHALEEHMDTDDLEGYDEATVYVDGAEQNGGSMEEGSSVWESRGSSSNNERPVVHQQQPRHSTLSEQQLSTLLTAPTPLPPTSGHPSHSLPTALPIRHERNEPQDSILGSLITSTQMSQVQPVSASSASATQTAVVTSSFPSHHVPTSLGGASGGAFTSILRSRLTTTSVTSTHSSVLHSTRVSTATSRLSSSCPGGGSSSVSSSMSLLRSQLSRQQVRDTTSTSRAHPASTSSRVGGSSTGAPSAFTHTVPAATRVTSSRGLITTPTPTVLSSTPSPAPTSTLQAILQSRDPSGGVRSRGGQSVGAGGAGSDPAGRCLVCGHHAVYQSSSHPNSHTSHHQHHQHILHAPQPIAPPQPVPPPRLPPPPTSGLLSVAAPTTATGGSLPPSSLPASTSRSSRSGRSRRRLHDTPRLAAYFESEMRQAIDRVRARQLDIRETLQALDHLQAETGADGAATTTNPSTTTTTLNPTTGGPTAGETGGQAATTATPLSTREEVARLHLALQSEPLLSDNFDMSTLLGETTSGGGSSSVSAGSASTDRAPDSTTTPASEPMAETPSSTTTGSAELLTGSSSNNNNSGSGPRGTAAVTVLSAELNRRIEHLNQLERNVSDITQRLGVRMRSLNEERRRDLGRLRSRISTTQYSLSSRLRDRQDRLRAHLDEIRRRYRVPGAPRVIPEITVTPSPDENGAATVTSSTTSSSSSLPASTRVSDAEAELRGLQASLGREDPIPDVAQWSRNMNRDIENMRAEMVRRRQRERERERTWHTLQRRHLHPHYAVSILDDTINRQNDGLQAAINRAIAGAFMGTGEAAVASNIVNLTHRIQAWDFTKYSIPDICDGTSNVLVPHCKLHNDASVDISQDGKYLATFVPSHRGFPDDTILGVFSLQPDAMGQCLYTKSFGPNAISLSLSPLNNYVLVGLAAKRLAWVFTPKQMVAQVYKLKTVQAGEDSMEHICDLMHPCDLDIRTHISVNSARWLPRVGEGIVYGTNRGDLHVCRPGDDEKDHKAGRSVDAEGSETHSIRRNIMQMLGIAVPSTTSTSTQTIHRLRRTASTQTDTLPAPEEP